MGLKVVESQAEQGLGESAPAPSAPWFASGLVLLGILAIARVLLGFAWGARLASTGLAGPTAAGSLAAATLLLLAGMAARRLGGGRLAQLCAGLGVLASPALWVVFEGWRFSGELTVGLGALALESSVSMAVWMVGWVPLALATLVSGFSVWRLLASPRRGTARVFSLLTAIWVPILGVLLAWASFSEAVIDGTLLTVLAAWSWVAAIGSGLGTELLLARADSRSPLHLVMLAFLVQLVLTAAWVLIGYR